MSGTIQIFEPALCCGVAVLLRSPCGGETTVPGRLCALSGRSRQACFVAMDTAPAGHTQLLAEEAVGVERLPGLASGKNHIAEGA